MAQVLGGGEGGLGVGADGDVVVGGFMLLQSDGDGH